MRSPSHFIVCLVTVRHNETAIQSCTDIATTINYLFDRQVELNACIPTFV